MGVPERVSNGYYTFGLFCSSHPIILLAVAIGTILVSCYPLLYLPLPGDVPVQLVTPGDNLTLPENRTTFLGDPDLYIQQVVIRTGVSPWTSDLQVHDAYRSPIHKVFSLLETIQNYQLEDGSITLDDLCLHIESVKLATRQERKKLLPEYGCLMLSPANFWQQDELQFQSDSNLLSTMFNHHSYQKGKISLAEILFGINIKETGLKRYPLRSRARTVQFAVTMVLKKYNERWIAGLKRKLESQYPLHVGSNGCDKLNCSRVKQVVHIYYPEHFNVYELLPLTILYVAQFLYIYFSLRKVEPVKSKVGIAFSACVTVISCLLMSVGLCFFFGVTASVSGKEVFPYLVSLVGLENVLVITKSVTSTPAHLDPKIRIAQGLSKEGWSITKNLLLQVTLLTLGLLTFISTVQELCILGLTGLFCDIFLQLFFFTTILSIDMHRAEMSQDPKSNIYVGNPAWQKMSRAPDFRFNMAAESMKIHRSKSHHNLNTHSFMANGTNSTNVVASAPGSNAPKTKTSRRLQLVHIWAKTRFFQRILMVALVAWICCILYSTSFLQRLLQIDELARFHDKLQDHHGHTVPSSPILDSVRELKTLTAFIRPPPEPHKHIEADHYEEDETTAKFKHRDLDPHRRLSAYHWPVMLSLYNLTLTDRYITVLPSIRLSHAVPPTEALRLRNPQETLHWSTLAVALDPLDFSADSGSKSSSPWLDSFDRPFIPRSPMEIALSGILILVSVVVLSYMTVVLYRCVCTRNYAEWRSSWLENKTEPEDNQVVLEAVALSLEGHSHEVECIATDCYNIVSSDLTGQIRVWSAYDGDRVCHIDRTAQFERQISDPDLNHSDYESGSPPSRDEPERNRLSLQDSSPPRVPAPVWCLDCRHGVVAVGCADGLIEFWTIGKHKKQSIFDDGSRIGVTSLKLVDNKVVAARLNGSLEFLQIEYAGNQSNPKSEWGFSASRRTHVRAASAGSALDWNMGVNEEQELTCTRLHLVRAHQQPITALECENGRVVTGSQDHTLKVLRLDDYSLLYTLHGHCGPITCMFIDRVTPYLSGSGSQDGLLCVWDLLTGACMYSLQAHDGSITALTYSASYVISLGADEKLCVWERFLGYLLNTINVTQTFSTTLAMVTHNLLVSSKQGSLVLWDVRTGEPVRIVRLGHNNNAVFVKLILQVGDSVVCDYGSQLRLVRFPIVTDKTD